MASERWREIERIYHLALERDPDTRAAFVAAECGDDRELVSEVQSLLANHERSQAFLEMPALQEAVSGLVQKPDIPTVSRVGHYTVIELLGSGGMGEVYRAWDEVLERDVAVKILRTGVDGEPCGPARLRGEGRAAARLTHPNICTVHEVDQFEGRSYLVMEYVDGRTLAQLLADSRLPLDRVVRHGIEIADALAHAHERNVLHRDLKPANVMITKSGHVKVVDFGIARRLDRSSVEAITRAGADPAEVLAGTVAYMAPELLRGEPADSRTDVWALGVLLHEMASGELPFAGHTEFELAGAILASSPRPLPDDTPPAFRSVLLRCLAKSRDERYESAADVRDALTALSATELAPFAPASAPYATPWQSAKATWRRRFVRRGTAVIVMAVVLAAIGVGWWATRQRTTPAGARAEVPTPVLAVVPFVVEGADTGEGQLGIGIADGVALRLGMVQSLRVMPSRAVTPYAQRQGDAQDIGRDLGVTHVLYGSVRRTADGYDVAARLLRADDGSVTWAERFTADNSLIRVEQGIAQRVARVLNVRGESARARLEHQFTTNSQAYEEYLRGRAALVDPKPQSIDSAVRAFQKALQLDPDFAAAQAGLAMALVRSPWLASSQAEGASLYKAAMAAAARASQLDPELPQAHEALAAVYRYTEFQWDDAITESIRALELSPSLDLPYQNLAAAFYHLGLFELSDRAARAGAVVNPRARLDSKRNQGRTALYDGRFETAARLLAEVEPVSDDGPRWMLAEAWFYLGEFDRSVELLERIERGRYYVMRTRAAASLAAVLASRGNRIAAEGRLKELTVQRHPDHHVSHRIGTAYAQLGRPEEAVHWLKQAANTGFPCYACFDGDPLLEPVRTHPAFQEFLDELRPMAELRRARYTNLVSPLF